MTKRTVYDVLPSKRGWRVKRRGAQRACNVFRLKSDAVHCAMLLAEKHKPSSVVIHKVAGSRFLDERTHGNDPFPPKG